MEPVYRLAFQARTPDASFVTSRSTRFSGEWIIRMPASSIRVHVSTRSRAPSILFYTSTSETCEETKGMLMDPFLRLHAPSFFLFQFLFLSIPSIQEQVPSGASIQPFHFASRFVASKRGTFDHVVGTRAFSSESMRRGWLEVRPRIAKRSGRRSARIDPLRALRFLAVDRLADARRTRTLRLCFLRQAFKFTCYVSLPVFLTVVVAGTPENLASIVKNVSGTSLLSHSCVLRDRFRSQG